jgi:hypothetical protein
MSMYYLPTWEAPQHYEYQTDLEGKIYTLNFYWNQRAGAWFLSVSDLDGNRLVAGRKVLLNTPILGRAIRPDGPPGLLYAVDTSGEDTEPGQTDFGGRVRLVYVDLDQV